jgi:hypothetical protein
MMNPATGDGPRSIEEIDAGLLHWKHTFAASLISYIVVAAMAVAVGAPVVGLLLIAVGLAGAPLAWRAVKASHERLARDLARRQRSV